MLKKHLYLVCVALMAFAILGCAKNKWQATKIFEPGATPGSMLWVYIQDQGAGADIVSANSEAITVETSKPGSYIVTFPEGGYTGCTATLNNSVGFVTCVPGDQSGLAPNQVQVMTLNPDNSFGPRDFTLTVYPKKE